jgi:hypothetical protein
MDRVPKFPLPETAFRYVASGLSVFEPWISATCMCRSYQMPSANRQFNTHLKIILHDGVDRYQLFHKFFLNWAGNTFWRLSSCITAASCILFSAALMTNR